MSRFDWMEDARCAQVDPELWHPDGSGVGYSDAKKICARCPVQQQCADFAQETEGDLAHSHRHGLWAGQLPRRRANQSNKPAGFYVKRRQQIIRLAAGGDMDSYQIAEHVGVDVRTVWRITRQHRQDMGKAA
ncbi:WhiB family transcriptional regulator [Streptomyces ziwulingensis]|uniref:4Fe-4S Wbl-type domain-containing protein n=1 Tax=Streptomyces ziwulingensis TaxID=1045501 RepID=A0ABP9D264_9ACTN